jgi:hypothetical protein
MLIFGAIATVAACVTIVSTNRMLPFPEYQRGQIVASPFRAHLTDGSTIIFSNGGRVGRDTVAGIGMRYTATLDSTLGRFYVPTDSILGLEMFNRDVSRWTALTAPVTLAVSTAGVAVGTLALLVAIFGSCPTIYADSAGTAVLQAEAFSYSIAPLLGKRDVDRLSVAPDADGVIRLDVRNEALETHYIDHMELLEARHDVGELVTPVARGGFVAMRDLRPVNDVRDAAGRRVDALLRAADGAVFASDDSLVRRAARGDANDPRPLDHLEFSVARPAGRDSLALLFQMRSSLLSTAVFYDHMLGHHGGRAIDWIGRDMARITTVAQVARWYTGNFGLRVEVRDGNRWRQVVRLVDFGPVAWRTVAAIIPDARDDSVRVRLSFTPDEFRIDRVSLSWDVRPVRARAVPLARVTDNAQSDRADVMAALAKADDHPLVTRPGERFFTFFRTEPAARGTRTYFVVMDGYYIEWVRGSWLRAARDTLPFSPHTDVRDVLRTWLAGKDSLEAQFFRNRVPVL